MNAHPAQFSVEPFAFVGESAGEYDGEFASQEWEDEANRRRRRPRRAAQPRAGVRVWRRPRPWLVRTPGASDYVRWVQSSLNQIMALRLMIDGVMGTETRSAIRSFQERQGLPVDGIVGPDTERALIAAQRGKSPESDSTVPASEFDFEWAGLPPYAPPLSQSSSAPPISYIPPRKGCEVLDNFDIDKDTLKPDHQTKINEIARRIVASQSTAQPIRSVKITGHADPSGKPDYNLRLGLDRANNVKSALFDALSREMERSRPGSGIQIDDIVTSAGETAPIQGVTYSKLRRVEVCLLTTPTKPAPPRECVMAPPSASKLPPVPMVRTCCMLAPPFVDPTNLGQHGTSNEVNGQIYSGMAGFLDLGHIRFTCDMTKFIYDQLTQVPMPKTVVAMDTGWGLWKPWNYGEAVMNACPRPGQEIDVARAIAYDAAWGHELTSYWENLPFPGGHHSSFSPEDLCSNFLGTVLAERAIKAGGNFNTAVTRELDKLIRIELKGQTPIESRRAFDSINGCWVRWSDRLGRGSFDDGYLRRRNFTPIPWKAKHASNTTTPGFVIADMPNVKGMYSYTHKEPPAYKTIPRSSFDQETYKIQQFAKVYYDGPNSVNPSCP